MTDDVDPQDHRTSASRSAPIQALRGVDFELRRGEIHALAGENGAGKSTLMNIIDGILQARQRRDPPRRQAGRDHLAGHARSELGIGFVHQEIALCPDVTVAENIFMARDQRQPDVADGLSRPRAPGRARSLRAARRRSIPRSWSRTLSISQQQLVEIAKALTLDCRVLILDEPTAALTEREAQTLFGIMRKLAARGISIIYISHRMVEIFDNCDRVTVFRDGQSHHDRRRRRDHARTTSSTRWSAASSTSSTRPSRPRRSSPDDASSRCAT